MEQIWGIEDVGRLKVRWRRADAGIQSASAEVEYVSEK